MKAFCVTIAKNCSYDVLRKSSRIIPDSDEALSKMDSSIQGSEHKMLNKEKRKALLKMLEVLSSDEKVLLACAAAVIIFIIYNQIPGKNKSVEGIYANLPVLYNNAFMDDEANAVLDYLAEEYADKLGYKDPVSSYNNNCRILSYQPQ